MQVNPGLIGFVMIFIIFPMILYCLTGGRWRYGYRPSEDPPHVRDRLED